MKSSLLFCSVLFALTSLISPVYSQILFEPGNRWDYIEGWWDGSGNGERDTISYFAIEDTLMSNGKLYHRVRPSNEIFKDYFRLDSAGIWYYDENCSQEWLYYCFLCNVNEEVVVPTHDCDTLFMPARIRKNFDSTGYIFGEEVRLMSFVYDGGIDIWYGLSFSPKFGFTGYNTSSIFQNYYKNLMGCIISEVRYGELLLVRENPYIPGRFALYQNYPNPFNPSTTIEFDIPFRQKVIIRIYDLLGNEIKKAVDEEKDAGKNFIHIDLTGFSSGVYIYKLQTETGILNRKMLMIK